MMKSAAFITSCGRSENWHKPPCAAPESVPYYVQQATHLMTDTEQLHQDFLNDFNELLKKYKAEFELMEGIPEIFFHGGMVEGQKELRNCSSFTLPNYINPN